MDEPDEQVGQPLKLNYAAQASEARWVTLGRYTPLEAQLAQAKIQAEGIPCNLADRHTANIYFGAIGIDVRLEVLSDDLERARAILEEVRAKRGKDKQNEPYFDEDWRCSKCRSGNISSVALKPAMLVLTLLLLGWPLMFIKRQKRCGDCGHIWSV